MTKQSKTSSVDKKVCLRIVDANLNRVTEGLRVCEDIIRFVIEDKSLQKKIKTLRHNVKDAKVNICEYFAIVSSRNIKQDIGKKTLSSDSLRKNFLDLFMANSQRVKESLRTLEETLKLIDINASEKFKKIRFSFYDVEKKGFKKIQTYLKR